MANTQANTSCVALRRRPDLIIQPQTQSENGAWVVKDPISLRYFTLSAQEIAILRWLDGAINWEELRRKFEAAFPPLRVTPQQLLGFVANLYENGLLLGEGPDQSQLLSDRGAQQIRRARLQAWTNLLTIRFRGIDPDRFLTWMHGGLRWCFSTWFLGLCLISVLAASLFAATHYTELREELPELHTLLHPSSMIWLLATFAIAKVLHEFGHALTCKHFGGECHEMGVMLLLCAPTLYCNVTDSWMLRSRWQRIAVSIAGILVELQIAAIAIFIWWYSQPGLLRSVALNLIVVCSVGTFLFNGNPLLRYDGYFVLADLLGISNLWQESRAALRGVWAKWFLANAASSERKFGQRRPVILAYGVASTAYQIFILGAIFLLLYRTLIPLRLGILIPLLAASLVASTLVVWIMAARRFWERPLAWRRLRLGRIATTGLLFGTVLWVFFAVPMPCRISAPALMQSLGAERVYVSTPGILVSCVSPDERVAVGQVIARMEDVVLSRDIERLVGKHRAAELQVENLRARLINDPDLALQLIVAQEMLADVEHQLAQRRNDARALNLKAPRSGVVMEPPATPAGDNRDQILPQWTGTPLDRENQRCYLSRGAVLCLVGDPQQQEAEIFVDETDVQYVRLDQRIRLQFDIGPAVQLSGRIIEIAKRNIEDVPRELAVAQELANRTDSSGRRRPVRSTYTIRISLDQGDERVLTGTCGQAKIEVEPQTLAKRLLRVLQRALRVPT